MKGAEEQKTTVNWAQLSNEYRENRQSKQCRFNDLHSETCEPWSYYLIKIHHIRHIYNFEFVFVFVYFQMYLYFIHSGTLFLRSSYHYLLKNIAPVMSICNFDQCCICVSVYLYLCICVFVFVYLKVRHPGTLHNGEASM